MNWFMKAGLGLIAISLVLSSLHIQHATTLFTEGFSIGLGLVLTIKGLFIKRNVAESR